MNARGCYGAPIDGYRDAPLVGIVHTPQDTEDEMNQLHNEIMQFGGEAQGQIEAATNLIKDEPGYKELLAKVKAAEAHSQSLREKYKGKGGEMHERVAKHLGFSPPDISAQWIRDYFRVRDPDLAKELDERLAAVKIWREREAELAAYFNRRAKSSSILAWDANIWDPFRQEWIFWRGDHLRPAQLWPGSGAWDRIQEDRKSVV